MTISSSLDVIDLATAIRCNYQIVSLSMPCVRGCTRILCSQCCDVSSILASHRSAGFALDDVLLLACLISTIGRSIKLMAGLNDLSSPTLAQEAATTEDHVRFQ
jgi:hypothetical protein